MKKFTNCEMKAATLTMRLKGGIAEYKIYGFALCEVHDDQDYVVLQPADLRCTPVMRVKKCDVASLTVQF